MRVERVRPSARLFEPTEIRIVIETRDELDKLTRYFSTLASGLRGDLLAVGANKETWCLGNRLAGYLARELE